MLERRQIFAFASDSTAIVMNDDSKKVNVGELPQFTFDILATATDQFHESKLLGRGGFGPVYKVQSFVFFAFRALDFEVELLALLAARDIFQMGKKLQ